MVSDEQLFINKTLDLIMISSHKMPVEVFCYYKDNNKTLEEKCFYNLVAESFLTLFSYCDLMFKNAWSQAFALLRVGLEQVAKIYLLSNNRIAFNAFVKLNKLKVELNNREANKDELDTFVKENGIPRNKREEKLYFDYGWLSSISHDRKYGIKQLIQLAHLEEFLDDLDKTLNAFAHGTISVFDMNEDNWNEMRFMVEEPV